LKTGCFFIYCGAFSLFILPMKTSWTEIFAIVLGIILLSVYTLPWREIGITLPVNLPEYKLGLDLNGGVELDYQVDMTEAKKQKTTTFSENNVVESLKGIIEKRVNSLGTAEPNIQTASYGNEKHIIVQIPTISFGDENLTENEKKARNDEYIQKAKDTIGKVIRLEFKEEKTPTDADKAERKQLAMTAKQEIDSKKYEFDTVGAKYRDTYENVSYQKGTGSLANLPSEVAFSGIATVTTPMTTDVFSAKQQAGTTVQDGQEIYAEGGAGFSIVRIEKVEKVEIPADVSATGATAPKFENVYTYKAIFVNEKPSEWATAKTKDGSVLDEKYLTRATAIVDQMGQPEVELTFNKQGAAIFSELTDRLVGKRMAIFVGGQLLTDPTVSVKIPDGKAVITGNYTNASARELANNINTGIVPAPIYLTSERTIDAKIGANALGVIVQAGALGFLVILLFLIWAYRVGGVLAGIALFAYTLLVVASVRATGIVLTLASIAGLVLSVGLAIDANILIFERTKEMLKKKTDLMSALEQGFEHSWSAIWDSHVTSFVSAVILYIFGVSLIKGFGLMLGLGIVISLFSAMYISRILIMFVAEHYSISYKVFLGESGDDAKIITGKSALVAKPKIKK